MTFPITYKPYTYKLSNKILLRTLWKSNKRSISVFITIFAIILLLVTVVFINYSNYQTFHFRNFVTEEKDWRNDKELSSYAVNSISRSNFTLTADYLDEIIFEMSTDLNNIIPGIVKNSTVTGLVNTNIYSITNNSFSDIFGLSAFSDHLQNNLSKFIVAGRMPVSSNEILYYNTSTGEETYSLNDQIQISLTNHEIIPQNLTIVGILSNLEEQVYSNGNSKDIINWRDYLTGSEIPIEQYSPPSARFFTTQDKFAQIFNYNSTLTFNCLSVVVDFDYEIHSIKLKKLASYITILREFGTSWKYFYSYNEGTSTFRQRFNPFFDLLDTLDLYYELISQEVLRIFIFTIPFISIVLLALLETTNNNKQGFASSINLMKSNGIKKQQVRNLLFITSLIMVCISVFVGVFSGIFISYLIALSFKLTENRSIFFEGLTNSFYIYIVFMVSITLTIGVFILLNRVQKEDSIVKSRKTNRKLRNTMRKMFSIPEILSGFIGLTLLMPSITGLILMTRYHSLIFNYTPINSQISYTILFTFFFFGIFFVFLTVSQLLSKAFIICWTYFSTKLWSRVKNQFTLSLKTLTNVNKNYSHLLISIFLISLIVYPGLVISNSMQNHNEINSFLASGCSDVTIPKWDQNQILRTELVSYPYVNNSAEIKIFQYHYIDDFQTNYFREYSVNILAICNLTQFVEVVNFSEINRQSYYSDILLLEEEGTYLMSSNFAHSEKYSSTNTLKNSDFARIKFELSLEFVNSFDFFPLLVKPKNNPFDFWHIEFNLVTSLETADALYHSVKDVEISESNYLLLNLNSLQNISDFENEIQQKYKLSTITQAQKLDYYSLLKFDFTIFYLIFLTVFSFLISAVTSFLVSRTMYNLKHSVIEIEHSIGATKNQIALGLITELIVVTIIPLITSLTIGFLFVKYLGSSIFTSFNSYLQFRIIIPIGILFLVILLEFLIIIMGSLLKIVPSIKNYYPAKQE